MSDMTHSAGTGVPMSGRPMVPSTYIKGIAIALAALVVVGGLELLINGTLNMWSAALLTAVIVLPLLAVWLVLRWLIREIRARWQ